jgi:putative phage-type endonuclease
MAFTEKQKLLRGQGVGGSEVAAVLGVHPKMTAFDVWAHKTGKLPEREHDQDPTGNLPAYLGTKLEPLVADVYEHRHPEFVCRPADTVVHPDYTFAIVTPDRNLHRVIPGSRQDLRAALQDIANVRRAEVVECEESPEKLLEIKTKSWRTARAFGEQGTDEVPADVLCQAHWQLFVTRFAVVDVAVLIDGRDYREYTVHADPELHASMLEEVRRFWHGNVLADIPPEMKGRAVDPYLRQKFVMHDDMIARADALGEEWLTKLHEARLLAKNAEEEKEHCENQVKNLIGVRKGIQGEIGKATWSQTKDAEKVDWQQVAGEYRTIIELIKPLDQPVDKVRRDLDEIRSRCTKIVPGSRRFLFTPAKEAK